MCEEKNKACKMYFTEYRIYFPMIPGEPKISLCEKHFQEIELSVVTGNGEEKCKESFREMQAKLAIEDIQNIYASIDRLKDNLSKSSEDWRNFRDHIKVRTEKIEERLKEEGAKTKKKCGFFS